MYILLSNDDGYLAPGLSFLYEALLPLAKIIVIAPESNHSGASNSVTLQRPLYIHTARSGPQEGFFYVTGTPTDCVHIALTGFLKEKPDLVISGINQGQNMGEDVFYSGTVAAAIEGVIFGIPAIAFSQNEREWKNLDTAVMVAKTIVERFCKKQLKFSSTTTLLNVNIPGCKFDELTGMCVTRLGKRHAAQGLLPQKNPRGEQTYWIGAAGKAKDAGYGTDFYAVANNQVSLTPLNLDLTNYAQMPHLEAWIRD